MLQKSLFIGVLCSSGFLYAQTDTTSNSNNSHSIILSETAMNRIHSAEMGKTYLLTKSGVEEMFHFTLFIPVSEVKGQEGILKEMMGQIRLRFKGICEDVKYSSDNQYVYIQFNAINESISGNKISLNDLNLWVVNQKIGIEKMTKTTIIR